MFAFLKVVNNEWSLDQLHVPGEDTAIMQKYLVDLFAMNSSNNNLFYFFLISQYWKADGIFLLLVTVSKGVLKLVFHRRWPPKMKGNTEIILHKKDWGSNHRCYYWTRRLQWLTWENRSCQVSQQECWRTGTLFHCCLEWNTLDDYLAVSTKAEHVTPQFCS